MLDDRPVLRERLFAAATFASIAIGTLFALDFIVTGGFDFGARRSASSYGQSLLAPTSAVAAPPPDLTVTALSLIAPTAIDAAPPVEQTADASENLAPDESAMAPSEDQLYRDIAALYAEQDARQEARESQTAEESAPAQPAHDDPAFADDDLLPTFGVSPSAADPPQ